MERKYELVKNDTIVIGCINLYRIKALRDFGDVKKGDIGGYIETEENLSHKGLCWVSDNARVHGNSWISGNAQISGSAWIYGNSWIYGNALVCGNSWISGDTFVYGNARISGDARVVDNTKISGNANVSDNARVSGYANISKDANICKPSDYVTIGPIGIRDDYTTFYKTKIGYIMVSCGYFNGTIDEFIKEVNITHKDNDTYRNQYLGAIEYIKTILI